MSHLDEGRLNAFLDGELDAAELRELERHLADCAECAHRMEEARGFFSEADSLIGTLEPPAVIRPLAVPGVLPVTPTGPTLLPTGPVAVPDEPPVALRLSRYRQLAWAASVVLAVSLGYFANDFRRSRSEYGEVAVADSRTNLKTESVPAPSAPSPAPSTNAPATDAQRGPAPAMTAFQNRTRDDAKPAAEAPARAPARAPAKAGAEAAPKAAAKAPEPSSRGSVEERGRVADAANQAPAPMQQMAAPTGAAASPPISATQRNLADSAANGTARASTQAEARRADSEVRPLAPGYALAQPLPADRVAAVGTTPASGLGIIPPNPRPTVPGFFLITMDDAVRRLAGTIHLIDGMTPDRVEAGSGRLISGAEPGTQVVRVIYVDPPARELWLDQQRSETWTPRERREADDASRLGSPSLLPGDTVVSTASGGSMTVHWLDGRGFWLSLTGNLSADSLLALVKRVR